MPKRKVKRPNLSDQMAFWRKQFEKESEALSKGEVLPRAKTLRYESKAFLAYEAWWRKYRLPWYKTMMLTSGRRAGKSNIFGSMLREALPQYDRRRHYSIPVNTQQ